LNPVFSVDGREYVMATQFISVLPTPTLKMPIARLSDKHDEIVAALDMLFQGF